MTAKVSPASVKQGLARRISEISSDDFARSVLGAAGAGNAFDDLQVSTVQNDGTGPATVTYKAAGVARVIGKLFSDESGVHSYEMLQALWSSGFNRGQRYQVPEPIEFLSAQNGFLMKVAPGRCLASYLAADFDVAADGVKEAARWLVKLHGSPLRRGRIDQPWYIFLKLADRLSKVSALHPDLLRMLIDLVLRLGECADQKKPVQFVQAHGQFRPIHVFLDCGVVTVIDLDRSAPSDPARDLAEFVHRLRTAVLRELSDAAEARERAGALTRVFLGEYAAARPLGASNLPFYHGFNVLVSFCRQLKRMKPEDPEWSPTIEQYSTEFDEALAGAFLPER